MSQAYEYEGDIILTFHDGNPELAPGFNTVFVQPVFTEEPPYTLHTPTITVYEPARFRYALVQSQAIGPGLPDFSLTVNNSHGTLTFYKVHWSPASYSYLTQPDEDGYHYTIHMREL